MLGLLTAIIIFAVRTHSE